MKLPGPNLISFLLPAALLAHQLEEYYGGFPLWYSNQLNVDLSNNDFIYINTIGFILITTLSISYFLHKSNFILVALGTLMFVNGIIHSAFTLFTFRYSPGTITGFILLIPLGIVIYKQILPEMKESERALAILVGIIGLFTVSMIAMNM